MCRRLESTPLCEYKSTRYIRVRNPILVISYYTIIFLVLCYVALYTIWIEKGYQKFETVVGTTSVKLKGTASIAANSTNDPINSTTFNGKYIYDAMDLVIPSMEENAFFIATSMISTINQKRGKCSLDSKDLTACSTDSTCTAGKYNNDSQGIETGICDMNTSHCELYSWCPLESNSASVISNIGEFTAMIKIDIAFPTFDVSRTNMLDKDGNGAPIFGYNLFSINYILQQATDGAITDVSEIAEKGAIILMSSKWNCNLDKSSDECNPEYTFDRIDAETDTISLGYNFRTVDYNVNMNERSLRKFIGMRVVFVTEGQGGKFSFAALTITFGAGLAYLGIASVLTDILLEKFLPQSKLYFHAKARLLDVGVNDTLSVISASASDYRNLPENYNEQDNAEKKINGMDGRFAEK